MSVYMTEEEQLEAIKKWWKRYSTPILMVLSVIMLIIAGYRYISWHQEKVAFEASNSYERLMIAYANGNSQEIKSYANDLINHHSESVYADAARLLLAKVSISKNHYAKAEKLLSDLSTHSKSLVFKQIAQIRLARVLLAEKSYEKALSALSIVHDKAYEPLVLELTGDILTASGQYTKAVAAYRSAIEGAKKDGLPNLFLEMKTNELARLNDHASKNNQAVKL